MDICPSAIDSKMLDLGFYTSLLKQIVTNFDAKMVEFESQISNIKMHMQKSRIEKSSFDLDPFKNRQIVEWHNYDHNLHGAMLLGEKLSFFVKYQNKLNTIKIGVKAFFAK